MADTPETISDDSEEKAWGLIRSSLAVVRPLGCLGALFGLAALVGYAFGVETLYRPIAGGPATHPLTASTITALGLGILCSGASRYQVLSQRLLLLLAVGASSLRLYDVSFDAGISTWITPFQAQVLADLQAGRDNSMGLNSALMLLCVAVALTFNAYGNTTPSQFVASIAVAIPTVSFTGYAYGLESFYGQMSMLTATTGFALASAALASTANSGALRALLSPYIGGKIARLQTLAGYAVPTCLGYLLTRSFNNAQTESFGLFVVAICWFIILMVCVAAIFQERTDRQRRAGERQLAEAAMSDSLTGLANRRKFLDFGRYELERCRRTGSPLWVLVLDVDRFKNINDTAGHAMGDKVLVALARFLEKSVRSMDLVSRIGGEEFAVLLVDTSTEGVRRVAESIRGGIEQLGVTGWTDRQGPVTVSLGAAASDGRDTLEQTLKAADRALYRAKSSGRNQVVFDHDAPSAQVVG